MTPIDIADLEREIHGPQVGAFSERWITSHNIRSNIRIAVEYATGTGQKIIKTFTPWEVLSELLATGISSSDQPAWERAARVIESSDDERFRTAARNGLLPLISIDKVMGTRRIDAVAESMSGLTPEGVARWLLVDQETRRALALLFRLQGYKVADEPGVHDKILLNPDGTLAHPPAGMLPPDVPFSDALNLRDDQIRVYLKAVENAVNVPLPNGTGTTDYGVVEIAFTIFRVLGFPHGNSKFADELIKKYTRAIKVPNPDRRPGAEEMVEVTINPEGDLEPEDVAPLIDRLKLVGTNDTLRQVLARDGILGLIQGLYRMPALTFSKEWGDWKKMLDMMDEVSAIRKGTGSYGGVSVIDRVAALKKIKDLSELRNKKKPSDTATQRIIDAGKVESSEGEFYPQGFVKKAATVYGTVWKMYTSGFGKKK